MIVINARFLSQNVTGVQRFAIEISRYLKDTCVDIVFVAPHNILNKDVAAELGVRIVGKHIGHLWEQIDLPKWLRKNGEPLLVCFANTAPIFYKNKIDTLHDITFKRYPQTFSWKFRLAYGLMIPMILRSSKHVITVSEFSKEEISSFYGYPKDKMSVVYNAVGNLFYHIEDESLKREKYLFAVSSVKENKNFLYALEAFVKSQESLKDLKFYIAGDMKADSFKGIDLSKYEKNPNIKILGRISDEDLVRYYSNAVAFLFPSLYEGFGIPPLEAQACGCPAICANASCLPEIFGDSVLYCDPHNVDSLVDCMKRVCDEGVRAALIEKGNVNLARYSWDESAKRILKIIQASEQS